MQMISFNACKHLDYEPNYNSCHRQILGNGKLFWIRHLNNDAVQFCKLRGRLNYIDACHDMTKKLCSEYEMTRHHVDVSSEELERD